MAAQALVSSSSLTASKEVARNLLGGRSAQSPFGSRKSASFVVRAASTPPVKVYMLWLNYWFIYIYMVRLYIEEQPCKY